MDPQQAQTITLIICLESNSDGRGLHHMAVAGSCLDGKMFGMKKEIEV